MGGARWGARLAVVALVMPAIMAPSADGCAPVSVQPAGLHIVADYVAPGTLAITTLDNSRTTRTQVFDPTGELEWETPWDLGDVVRQQATEGRDGTRGILSIDVAQRAGCVHVAFTVRDAYTGAPRIVTDLGLAQSPKDGHINLVSTTLGDVTGDGVEDFSIEGRATAVGDYLGAANHEPGSYRDMTPGVPKSAFAWLVDGYSGTTLARRALDARLGVGILTGVGNPSGSPGWSTLEAKDEFSAVARSFGPDGVPRWQRELETLPAPIATHALRSGPAFVTGELVRVPAGPNLGLAWETMRITALDDQTGAILWSRDWTVAGTNLMSFEVEGDLFVDDARMGVLARLDGATGEELWTVRYVRESLGDSRPPVDLTGDRRADMLLTDTPVPMVVNGRDGSTAPRPLLGIGREVWVVPDLDGDGASDILHNLGAALVVGAGGVFPPAAGVGVLAYSGRTGEMLWRRELPPGQGQVEFAADAFTGVQRRTVAIYLTGGRIEVVRGADGTTVWTRDLS